VERTLLHSPFRCELQRLVSVDFTDKRILSFVGFSLSPHSLSTDSLSTHHTIRKHESSYSTCLWHTPFRASAQTTAFFSCVTCRNASVR
jgi:hypothetical protein